MQNTVQSSSGVATDKTAAETAAKTAKNLVDLWLYLTADLKDEFMSELHFAKLLAEENERKSTCLKALCIEVIKKINPDNQIEFCRQQAFRIEEKKREERDRFGDLVYDGIIAPEDLAFSKVDSAKIFLQIHKNSRYTDVSGLLKDLAAEASDSKINEMQQTMKEMQEQIKQIKQIMNTRR